MCNLGEAIAKKNREEGLEAGRKEGMEAGRKEGLEAGRKEGLEAGEGKFARLITMLIASGSSQADISKAASDLKYRQNLYAQYGIA